MNTTVDVTALVVAVFTTLTPIVLGGVIHIALGRLTPILQSYVGEKNMLVFQQRFDILASKAIGYAVSQGSAHLTAGQPLQIDMKNWLVAQAVNYCVQHAPDMAIQAGDLTEKIIARFDTHPAVQGVVGNAPPVEPMTAGA